MSPSELYLINFQNPEPKYYARIPHIIDHLTYDGFDKKGNPVVKRLSIQAIHLYRVLKSITGDLGVCWKNRDNLAEQANMSAGAISNAKEELLQKFHQLDLNPLIVIKKKKKSTKTGGYSYHEITISDIWKWNNGFMATLKFHKESSPSPHDIEKSSPSPHDKQPLGSPSPGDTNNNPLNKNPLLKEQQSMAKPFVASSKDKKRLFSTEDQKNSYDGLVQQGCHEPAAYKIAMTYPKNEIVKACEYTRAMNKKTPTQNKWGYLQNVLKNKYWKKPAKNL